MKHTEVGYGYYPGGDPRKFSPDPECCTVEENARWKAACEAWDRGETPDPGGPHVPLGHPLPDGVEPVASIIGRAEDGQTFGHHTVAHYGLGTYEVEWDCDGDPECHVCHPEAFEAAVAEEVTP